MRIISWNVNSIRARLPRLLAILNRHKPDIVCLQEIKVANRNFPIMQLNAAGYRTIIHGQPNYNGVAILINDPTLRCDLWAFDKNSFKYEGFEATSKVNILGEPKEIQCGFPGDPIPVEARVASVCLGNIRLVNVYVINGMERNNIKFDLKRRWMAALGKWLQNLPETPAILVVGDFNVAPDSRDVWDPVGLKDRIHCTDEERAWLRDLQGERLKDLLRVTTKESGIHTWWPYQQDAFEKNEGLRFDLALGDEMIVNMVKRVWVDYNERRPSRGVKPSDHAPVIVDLSE